MNFNEWHKQPEVESFINNLDEREPPALILKRIQKYCYEEGQKRPNQSAQPIQTDEPLQCSACGYILNSNQCKATHRGRSVLEDGIFDR